MTSGTKKVVGFVTGLGASLLAHGLLLALAVRVPLQPLAARSRLAPVEIEIASAAPEAAEKSPPVEKAEAAVVPEPPTVRVRRYSQDVPAATSASSENVVEPVAEPLTDPVAPAPTVAPPSAAGFTLSPRAVATAAFMNTPSAPSVTDDKQREQQLSAELSAGLRAAAGAARAPARRPPPELRRDPDGTCHYSGTAIEATILPDGGVRFADKPRDLTQQVGVATPPEHATRFEDVAKPDQLKYSFNASARGSETERNWFLRETESVRRELRDAARDREDVGNEKHLRRQLDGIWCDESRPLAQRKRELFEVWNGMSADAVGERGQKVVLEYVRKHAPEHTEQAFTRQELSAFNAQRVPSARFEPYASAL